MTRGLQIVCLVAAAIVSTGLQRQSPKDGDPARNLVRTRAFLTTTASALDFSIDGATLANAVFTVRTGPSSVREVIERNTIHVTGNTQGSSLDLQIDMILADVLSGTTIGWTLLPSSSARANLDLRNVNGAQSQIDAFGMNGSSARFTSPSDLLLANGPLGSVGGVDNHFVLAFFYPWWDLNGWSGPLFSDMPLRPYSTDSHEDLVRVMTQAKTAGIEALVVSWSGKDFNGQIDHRRMLACLSAARAAGIKIATLFETTVANPQHEDGIADPQTVFRWLVDVVDDYTSDASYLRAGSRPVVLAYAAQRMPQAGWADALSRLRATGRDVLLIGEGINATRLGALDGLFFYASNAYQGDEIRDFDRTQSLSVRTYHLLPNDTGRRRIWVATVSPGYDDRQLKDGRVPRVSDRDSGRYYMRQWQAATDMRADWIVITSWNEWLENTEIEPSVRYGDLYLRMTKLWSVAFGRQRAQPRR